MRTINDLIPTKFDIENSNYNYQTELTSKLDSLNCDFSQELINEIVLWKVNSVCKKTTHFKNTCINIYMSLCLLSSLSYYF